MQIKIDIPAKRIADLMTTAIESGYSTYWCKGVYIKGAWENKKTSTDWWYASPEVFAGTFTIEIVEMHNERTGETRKHRCNKGDFEKGFAAMAKHATGAAAMSDEMCGG